MKNIFIWKTIQFKEKHNKSSSNFVCLSFSNLKAILFMLDIVLKCSPSNEEIKHNIAMPRMDPMQTQKGYSPCSIHTD